MTTTLANFLLDPRWPNCINPLAAAIRLVDKIHVVSPTYAREVVLPNDPKTGFHGGEGLEGELSRAAEEGRLVGILNGIEYRSGKRTRPAFLDCLAVIRKTLLNWMMREIHQRSDSKMLTRHFLAHSRLVELSLAGKRPRVVLTSVGRIGYQKSALFRECTSDGVPALKRILDELGNDGLFIMLGAGESDYEDFFAEWSAKDDRFVFINGFSEDVANVIYCIGDLFLMPSILEPCGISQMLAMALGAQPCLVHSVGGLKDTVRHGENGFVFDGQTLRAKADNFVESLRSTLRLFRANREQWKALRRAAAETRFEWPDTINKYRDKLYRNSGGLS